MSNPARQGRSRKLSARDKRVLTRLVMSGLYDTAFEISRNTVSLGLPTALANTIRRALRRQGLVARVKARARPSQKKSCKSVDVKSGPVGIGTGPSLGGPFSQRNKVTQRESKRSRVVLDTGR